MGPLLSTSHSLSLGHLIPPMALMLTTLQIPISSTDLSPEPQTLRLTTYQPSIPGCHSKTPTNVSIADMDGAIDPSPIHAAASAVICLRAFFGHQSLHCLLRHQAKSAGELTTSLPPPQENPPTKDGQEWYINTQAPSPLWQETSEVHVLPGMPRFPQWIKLQEPRLNG